MEKRKAREKRIFQWVLGAELIICYMAFLTALSYARGPKNFAPEGEVMVEASAFIPFSGAWQDGDGFAFPDPLPGESVGFQSEISLVDIDGIQISFALNCPEGFEGGTLHCDLYNFDAGYDSDAQEFNLSVGPGRTEVSFFLEPGSKHPEKAFLRLFTLDRAGYRLEDLRVVRAVELPKVPRGVWLGLGVCFVLTLGTLALWGDRRDENSRKRGTEEYAGTR